MGLWDTRLDKRVLVCLVLPLLLAQSASATVMPTTGGWTSRADLILVGKVLDVDKPGEPSRHITFRVAEIVKGNLSLGKTNQITNVYHGMGKGNIDFRNKKALGTEHIRFLKYVPDPALNAVVGSFHLEFSDVWSGVQKAAATVIEKIKDMLSRSASIHEEHEETAEISEKVTRGRKPCDTR